MLRQNPPVFLEIALLFGGHTNASGINIFSPTTRFTTCNRLLGTAQISTAEALQAVIGWRLVFLSREVRTTPVDRAPYDDGRHFRTDRFVASDSPVNGSASTVRNFKSIKSSRTTSHLMGGENRPEP